MNTRTCTFYDDNHELDEILVEVDLTSSTGRELHLLPELMGAEGVTHMRP